MTHFLMNLEDKNRCIPVSGGSTAHPTQGGTDNVVQGSPSKEEEGWVNFLLLQCMYSPVSQHAVLPQLHSFDH